MPLWALSDAALFEALAVFFIFLREILKSLVRFMMPASIITGVARVAIACLNSFIVIRSLSAIFKLSVSSCQNSAL